MAAAVTASTQAWVAGGRDTAPRNVSGCFTVLGTDDPQADLQNFTYDYLEIFGKGIARAMADAAPVWNPERLHQVLDDAEAAGVDEFILVPGTTDPACLDAFVGLVAERA